MIEHKSAGLQDGRCWARTSDLRLVEAEPHRSCSLNVSTWVDESPAKYEVWTPMARASSVQRMTDETFWSALSVLRRKPR